MEKLLNKLGFTHVTGNIYRSDELGLIAVSDNATGEDIARAIFELGKKKKQEEIIKVLGIKNQN